MSNGGKGSVARPFSVDSNTFANNWDNIFGKKKAVEVEPPVENTNNLLEDLSKQARIQMASSERLKEYGMLIIKECLDAIEQTDRRHAHTTFDLGLVNATIAKSQEAIKKRFDINQG